MKYGFTEGLWRQVYYDGQVTLWRDRAIRSYASSFFRQNSKGLQGIHFYPSCKKNRPLAY